MSRRSKVVLITGASRGIGAATARLAARQGWDVAVNFVNDAASAEAVVQDVRAQGVRAVSIRGDVSRESDVATLFELTEAALGRIDSLVNNAGTIGQAGTLDTFNVDQMRSILDVNVLGSMLCAQHACRTMSKRHGGRGGSIVNVSSLAAAYGGANQWIPYAAAKGAVNSMTLGLAREYAIDGIRVNAVLPGLIDTEIHATAGVGDRVRTDAHLAPIGRIGTAEECARTIVWLMEPEPAYQTAGLIPIAGGR